MQLLWILNTYGNNFLVSYEFYVVTWLIRGVCISDMIPFYLGKFFTESGATDDVCSKVCSVQSHLCFSCLMNTPYLINIKLKKFILQLVFCCLKIWFMLKLLMAIARHWWREGIEHHTYCATIWKSGRHWWVIRAQSNFAHICIPNNIMIKCWIVKFMFLLNDYQCQHVNSDISQWCIFWGHYSWQLDNHVIRKFIMRIWLLCCCCYMQGQLLDVAINSIL